jgi:predicted ATPase
LLWAVPITELRIEGLRTIEKLRLTLDGLTVLIGDNGTGKSSILEACEILRRATGPRFLEELYGIHGGLTTLIRDGSPRLALGVTVRPVRTEHEDLSDSHCERIDYELLLIPDSTFATIEETISVQLRRAEGIRVGPKGNRPSRSNALARTVRRRAGKIDIVGTEHWNTIDEHMPFMAEVSSSGTWHDPGLREAQWVAYYLREFRVHIPFETIPAWAARALDRKSALRTSALLTPATHLEKLGLNLASSYHALKNGFGRAHWDHTLDYIRLGLGERIEDIVTWADPGGGNIGLSLKLLGLDRAIPSSQISDGMLSYLAFVALFRLHTTKPSLVAFDEPDLHLHPHLLMRVLDMFDAMARECPVLLATHSDRLLDGLTDPAKSVVLCELDERGATRLVRPDREALAKWLERYRGLGDIRGAGHAASVLTKVEPT